MKKANSVTNKSYMYMLHVSVGIIIVMYPSMRFATDFTNTGYHSPNNK